MKDYLLNEGEGLNQTQQFEVKSHKYSSRKNTLHTVNPEQPDIINSTTIAPNAFKTRIFVCCIFIAFILIEFIGGLISNSLAIMTDAAHLLIDLTSFLVTIYALQISNKPPNSNFTFGYHRAEIVGALTSIFLIWILTTILFIESISRLCYSSHIIKEGIMLITASIGLVFNGIMAYVLHSEVIIIIFLISIISY